MEKKAHRGRILRIMGNEQFTRGTIPAKIITDLTRGTVRGIVCVYGPHGELFFFFVQKEQVVASKEVLLNPCVSAETRKACALIGLSC